MKRPDEMMLKLLDEHVDELVRVSDDEIAQAMVHLIERSKLVVEGAGAAAVAALRSGRVECPAEGSCCVILSGGNVDASLLAECIRMGETASGRRTVIKTVVPDRPGRAGGAAADRRRPRREHHRRGSPARGVDLHVRETLVRLVIQTRGKEHGLEISGAMAAEGFSVEIEH